MPLLFAMSHPVPQIPSHLATLRRRSLLAALGLSPLLLSACGGGDADAGGAALTVDASARARAAAAQAVDRGLAGIAIGQIRGSQLELGIAGRRRVDRGTDLTGEEMFCIGSNAKSMTALIAAQLVGTGRLRWNSRLLDVEPALRAGCLPAYADTTLAQLLGHRSGVWALTQGDEVAQVLDLLDGAIPETRAAQRLALAAQVLGLPPQEGVVPGSSFHYSNAGYLLAGLMLERASGESFERLFETHVVTALQLPADLRAPAAVDAARQPWGHAGSPGALKPLTEVPAELLLYVDVTAAAGVAALTPRTYARWLQLHQRALRGEATVLPASYVQALRDAREGDYALGWSCLQGRSGGRVLVHIGAEHGFTALAEVQADGRGARFALSNTQIDEWVLEALVEALDRVA